MLEALRPASASEWDVWLVDVAVGRAIKTDLQESPYIPGYYWFPDRLIVAGWTELQEWDLTRSVRRVLPAKASTGWSFRQADWGPVTLTSPDGREVTHGEGLPLAWMEDGRLLLVRWPDYDYRRDPWW